MNIKFILLFASVSFFGQCKKPEKINTQQELNDPSEQLTKLMSDRANELCGFTLDSLKVNPTGLFIYVSDTINYLTFLPFAQKLDYMCQDLAHFQFQLPENFSISLHLPNREGEKYFPYNITRENFYKSLLKYKDDCFCNTVKLLVKLDKSNPDRGLINNLNVHLAYYIYKENMIKEAFEGVDSYVYLYGYIQENYQNMHGSNHSLIDSINNNLDSIISNDRDIKKVITMMDICSGNK